MLPQDYSYMVCGAHGTGIQAFRYFLQISNLSPMYWDAIGSEEIEECLNNFKKDFSKYFNSQKAWGIFLDRIYDEYTARHLLELKRKVAYFVLIRDPISMLKTGVNEMVNDYAVRQCFRKDLQAPKPSEVIRYGLFENYLKPLNIFSMINQPKNAIKEKIYIQTSDIIGENTFATMKKILPIIGSGTLKSKDDYNINFNGLIARSMPSYPTLCLKDGRKFQILIGTRISFYRYVRYHCHLDSTYKNSIVVSNFRHKKRENLELFVVVKNGGEISVDEIRNSSEAMELIMQRIDFFIDKTFEMEKLAKEFAVTENEVLEILNENLVLKAKAKEIMLGEVEPLRKEIPAILDGWKFYNKFILGD